MPARGSATALSRLASPQGDDGLATLNATVAARSFAATLPQLIEGDEGVLPAGLTAEHVPAIREYVEHSGSLIALTSGTPGSATTQGARGQQLADHALARRQPLDRRRCAGGRRLSGPEPQWQFKPGREWGLLI